MNPSQNQGPTRLEQFKATMNWVAFVSGALAVSVEVFLHRSRSFGERYLGLQSAAVLLVVPCYSLFWKGYDLTPLMQFLGVYLVMCFLARMGVAARKRRGGPQEHTRYNGYPRLMRLLRKTDERKVKAIVEPLLVFVVGALTMQASEPLGGYLMVAALGLLISVNLNLGYDRVRALDMHDAAIDQRQIAREFRDLRGGR